MGFFGADRASEITTTRIRKYIESRLDEDASNATVNRELAALKRKLNLGAKSTPPKVDRMSHIPMLRENNVRKGFFEHREFLRLRDELPSTLRGLVTFAFKRGPANLVNHLSFL
jgi:site-specific recombinase XerD